jgi:type I restriction enzyme S subunit
MSEWRQTTTAALLEEGVIEIGDGYRAKNSEFVENGGLPFVRVGDVNLAIRLEGTDQLPRELAGKYGPKVSRGSDSLITMKGTIGRVAYVSSALPPFVYSPQISYWRSLAPELVHPRWLRYWLESPEFLAQALATKGATDMADYINLRDQRRMRITLPPPTVQGRIADVLGAIDDLIENNRRRIEVLEEMAQAIYREWFVRFLYPGHEDATFVESALGPIPEGWETTTLHDLVTTQYGYTESATTTPVGPQYLRGMDINKTSYVDWSTVPYCAIEPKDQVRFAVAPGDVFVIRMADPGKVGICEAQVDAVFASYLVRLRPIDDRISSYYLFFTLRADGYQSWVTGASTGATRKSVSARVMTEPQILLAPRDLISMFDETVRPIRSLLAGLVQGNARLAALRHLLLPKLVAGQIDVSHLDLEVSEASVA